MKLAQINPEAEARRSFAQSAYISLSLSWAYASELLWTSFKQIFKKPHLLFYLLFKLNYDMFIYQGFSF